MIKKKIARDCFDSFIDSVTYADSSSFIPFLAVFTFPEVSRYLNGTTFHAFCWLKKHFLFNLLSLRLKPDHVPEMDWFLDYSPRFSCYLLSFAQILQKDLRLQQLPLP